MKTELTFPQILTLSGTIPGEPGVGGVILNDLQQSLPQDRLQFIPAVTNQIIKLGWLNRSSQLVGHVIRRYETGYRPMKGIAGELVGWAARKIVFERYCRKLIRQICENPAAQNAELIWAVLDCPTVLQIATEVAKQLNKPLMIMVWDDPHLLVDQFHLDRWSARKMLTRFHDTIRHASRVGVICEKMQVSYTQNYGATDCVVLRHGVAEEICQSPNGAVRDDKLIIGFAGSITAQAPFRQLIATLNDRNWNIAGRNVRLRLIGSRYTLDSRQPQHMEYFGWRDLPATVRLLSECDLLYLPQPFAAHLKTLAELSFPTKLSTYLAAGRRILLHAPEYASLTPFLEKYPVGLRCGTLEIADIRAALEQMCQLESATILQAVNQARHDEFNETVFHNRFAQLVGASESGETRPNPTEELTQHV